MEFINDKHKEMHEVLLAAVDYNDETPGAVVALDWYDKMISSLGQSSKESLSVAELRSEVAIFCRNLTQMRKEHDEMYNTVKVLAKFFNISYNNISDIYRSMESLYKNENGYSCLKYD